VPTDPRPITLFELVRRAVEISDPANADPRLGDLLAQFEDADEPVTAIDDPAVSMATATILYLAHRRDELGADPSRILRLAARWEWKGDPPERVISWLADRGVEV
jgi:hypothetical protein